MSNPDNEVTIGTAKRVADATFEKHPEITDYPICLALLAVATQVAKANVLLQGIADSLRAGKDSS